MTPDDVAYLHPSLADPGDPDCEAHLQPRPNVLFEAGMAMARDPDRTVIVELGQVRVFSDIHGRHRIRLDNSVKKRQDLAERLRTANCAVDTTGSDWHRAGDLNPPVTPGGGLPLGHKLPKSESAAVPRLDGRYIDNGPRKLSAVEITNHGPGDVYELDLEDAERDGIRRQDMELPVPKLPAGKWVRVFRNGLDSLGQVSSAYFTVTVVGKTIDGVPIREELFVSKSV
jgi:hypothetical protein